MTRAELVALPFGMYQANRYDTDDTHVLHLWAGGESWDILEPKGRTAAADAERHRLRALAQRLAARPCEASDFYDITEDGVSRCLDPEYNEGDPAICAPCEARAALAGPASPAATLDRLTGNGMTVVPASPAAADVVEREVPHHTHFDMNTVIGPSQEQQRKVERCAFLYTDDNPGYCGLIPAAFVHEPGSADMPWHPFAPPTPTAPPAAARCQEGIEGCDRDYAHAHVNHWVVRDAPPPAAPPAAARDCRCGHPFASHDVADDEPGPCWHGTPNPPSDLCPCDAFQPAPEAPAAAREP